MPQWGLLETAPAAARQKALARQQHIREVERGRPGGPEEYDPARWTPAEREQAKAAELTALGFAKVSRTTVQRMRLAYRKEGLWGCSTTAPPAVPLPRDGRTSGWRMP